MKIAQILTLGIPFVTSTTLYLTKLGSYNFIPNIKALVVQSQATMKKVHNRWYIFMCSNSLDLRKKCVPLFRLKKVLFF